MSVPPAPPDPTNGSGPPSGPPSGGGNSRQVAVITGAFSLVGIVITALVTLYVSGKGASGSAAPSGSTSSTVIPVSTPSLSPSAVSQISYRSQYGAQDVWYLDVVNGSSTPGTQITVFNDGSTSAGKQWKFYPTGDHRYILANSLVDDRGALDERTDVVLTVDANKRLSIEKYIPGEGSQIWLVDNSSMLHSQGSDSRCLGHQWDGQEEVVGMLPCSSDGVGWTLPTGL
jgi:hypothetical protein